MKAPHVTLRVNFTHEDKAAKGLRSLRSPQQVPETPVYFTAREAVEMFPRLLLLGERGSGKTVFARALAAETGLPLHELDGRSPQVLQAQQGPLILDGVDRLTGEAFQALLSLLGNRPVLLLGDGAVVRNWRLPAGIAVHTLMPLSTEERRICLAENAVAAPAALSPAAGNPALFALAATLTGSATTAEDIVDLALAHDAVADREALDRLRDGIWQNRMIDGLLAARHFARLKPTEIADLFAAAPLLWAPSLSSHLRRRPETTDSLGHLLMAGDTDAALRGALLVAQTRPDAPAVRTSLVKVVEAGRLGPQERNRAACILALNDDPRDLEALCAIPGGTFTMGSRTHPNSTPVHKVTLAPFSIGRFPVTNALYNRFVKATDRKWVSPDAGVPEKRNAPATDLTWHDACAYCGWLTAEWRRSGRIGADQIVRLPREPEWERASRGDQPDAGGRGRLSLGG